MLRIFLLTITALLLVRGFSMMAQAVEVESHVAVVEETRYVVPMGQAVGIKLFSDGVLVIGLSEIQTAQQSASPAGDSGIREGDIITHINEREVNTIEEVQAVLQELAGARMSVRVVRGSIETQLTAQAVQCSADGAYKLGAWIRDSMAGIGTMTFYEPKSGLFGTLGHGINDVDTSMLMPLQSGSILRASVCDVKKGMGGRPGELHGVFQTEQDIGSLYANTAGGVFGHMSDPTFMGSEKPVPIAEIGEIKPGKATIRSNISGETVEEFTVDITKVCPNAQDTRDLMIHVTDPRLISATGGIVQGMSGSPILQNGKLVGAVTHVLVNDPTRGYGISIEHMMERAETRLERVS
ncbi:MAG: SpoIVB peptidase [Evtepia sp.]